MADNAADPRRVGHGGRKERQRRETYLSALRKVLAMPAGRLVIADWIERTGVYRSVWHPNSNQMALNEGRRQVGLELMEDLVGASPALYDTLETERRARVEADGRETQAYARPDEEED